MDVTFYGVRGSTPCGCEANRRYGGNTACVVVDVGGEPIILDLGTGLRFFGQTQSLDGTFAAHALVSHLHWDHVQGLPFFVPIDRPGARLDVYAPAMPDRSVADAFDSFMCPPYFPIRCSDLRGEITFHDVSEGELAVGDAKVKVRSVPHIGPTNGYRVEANGSSVAYLSDHQAPYGLDSVPDNALELCDGVDLLVHDAQFVDEEWEQKAHWGHCTVDYALHVAAEAGAKQLALFHHDPEHDDAVVDSLLARAVAAAEGRVDEVIAAAERLTVSLG